MTTLIEKIRAEGGCVYPSIISVARGENDMFDGNEIATELRKYISPGMTKREAYAMAALQGMLSTDRGYSNSPAGLALGSFAVADAMLAESDKQ